MVATGYGAAGDPTKVDVTGDTMTGELLLPDSSPDTALAAASKGYVDAVGAAGVSFGNVTAQTSFGLSSSNGVATSASRSDHVHGTPADPGSGGASLTYTFARVVTGNVTAQNTGGAWQLLTGSPEISIAAQAGDRLRFAHSGLIDTNGTFMDIVIVSGAGPSIVRYGATATSSPATEGHPGIYATADASFARTGLTAAFTVVSGDIDTVTGTTVRFRFAVNFQGSAAVLYAGADYPMFWEITNLGAA